MCFLHSARGKKRDCWVLETILEKILVSPGMGGVSWDKISVDKMACKEQNYNERTDCCFFSFTKLPIYFIVSKLSQCITAFHGCSLTVSNSMSGGGNDQLGYCVRVSLPARAYPVPSWLLSVYLSVSRKIHQWHKALQCALIGDGRPWV